MSLPELFATAFVVGLTGAMMPGPLLAVAVTESLRRGWVAPVWLVVGHALLELATIGLLVAGLSAVVEQPLVLRTLAVVGGAVLAWMAVGAFRTARHPSGLVLATAAEAAHGPAAGGPARLMLTGAAVSISNPYWIIWWLTVGATYVLVALDAGRAGVPTLYVGHISSDFLWFICVGVAVAGGRRRMSPGVARALFLACAAVLAGFGVLFALAGFGLFADLTGAAAAAAA